VECSIARALVEKGWALRRWMMLSGDVQGSNSDADGKTVRTACRWKKCLAYPSDIEFSGSGMVMVPGLPVVED
jgi:hypothetical protein